MKIVPFDTIDWGQIHEEELYETFDWKDSAEEVVKGIDRQLASFGLELEWLETQSDCIMVRVINR